MHDMLARLYVQHTAPATAVAALAAPLPLAPLLPWRRGRGLFTASASASRYEVVSLSSAMFEMVTATALSARRWEAQGPGFIVYRTPRSTRVRPSGLPRSDTLARQQVDVQTRRYALQTPYPLAQPTSMQV